MTWRALRFSGNTSRGAKVVIAARSTDEARYQEVLGKVKNNKSGFLGIPDAGERGLVVTGAGTHRQKFQKFYDPQEFKRLLRRFFGSVEIASLQAKDSALVGVCTQAKPINPARLERALRFEFDLKINEDKMNRADRAVEVITRWLKRRR